jgi:hypothetical protein
MPLSKDDIVKAIGERKRETMTVPVPEWGGDVLIRHLLTDDLESSGVTERQDPETMVKAIALSVCDEGAEPLFALDADGNAPQVLRDLDTQAQVRLFAAIARFNGMTSPELEEMVASFDAAPHDDSSSD